MQKYAVFADCARGGPLWTFEAPRGSPAAPSPTPSRTRTTADSPQVSVKFWGEFEGSRALQRGEILRKNRRQAVDCVKAYGCVSVCQPARTLFFRSFGRPATGSLRDPAALRKCPLRGRKSSLREQKNMLMPLQGDFYAGCVLPQGAAVGLLAIGLSGRVRPLAPLRLLTTAVAAPG